MAPIPLLAAVHRFSPGPAPAVGEALRRITEIFRIEEEIRGRPADERRALRQEKPRPIVRDPETWLRPLLVTPAFLMPKTTDACASIQWHRPCAR